MKWNKRIDDRGNIGGGYESGKYIIKETFNSQALSNKYGGKRKDYYWVLMKGEQIIKYASTAKALKAYVNKNA